MTLHKRHLLTWADTPGFLCDWHLAGFFDSGLVANPAPALFEPKQARYWDSDPLAPLGGCGAVTGVPGRELPGAQVQWLPAALVDQPALSLNLLRELHPRWEALLREHDPDTWSSMYYALALVESPCEREALLHFCGWDGCRLWINGEFAFQEHSYHHVILDKEQVRFRLRRGLNSFLFQLDRDGVAARVELPNAAAELRSLRSVRVGEAPAERAVSTFTQMRRYLRGLRVRRRFNGDTAEELEQWRKHFRAFYHQCLGPAPLAGDDYGRAEQVSSIRCEGYEERRFMLRLEGGSDTPCCVLVPEAARRNGRTVIHPHGHAFRFEMLTGRKRYRGHRSWIGDYAGDYARCLARRGFVTAVMCERAFEERRDWFSSGDPCNAAHLRALAMGLTLPRLHIADLHVLHALVSSLPEVEPGRIGISGLSGGGTLSYLAGAYDERFRAVAVFCGVCSYADYAQGGGCGMQVVPGLYPTGDTSELLALIAPRPLLVAQGRLDSTFSVPRARQLVNQARPAYAAAGAAERIEFQVVERAHEYDPDVAERFFTKWL